MPRRKGFDSYSLGYLIAFAGILAMAYLVVYVNAGLSNSNNFTGMWMYLAIGLLFLLTTLAIPKDSYLGWVLYIVSLVAILVQCIASFSVAVLPMIVLTIFALLHIMSEDVKALFGV